MLDNKVQSDEYIDFGEISSDSNGKGLYYTSTATEDNKVTYYFRGAVNNNYVYFANYYWRIVRINEDGSVRLIYQGKNANATGENTIIGTSNFNPGVKDNSYLGYMSGTLNASTYLDTHTNTNESTIKQYIDDWYEANLKDNYSSYLADAGFCNDRSLSSSYSSRGYGSVNSYYMSYQRLMTDNQPEFACPNPDNDLFTLKGGSKGNKKLDYPIGLITADEVAYAGGKKGVANKSYYLYGYNFWSMSPRYVYNNDAAMWAVGTTGGLGNGFIMSVDGGSEFGVRPVINLSSNTLITTGNGTSAEPYIIKTN